MNKKFNYYTFNMIKHLGFLFALMGVLIFNGCNEEDTIPSLWDPNYVPKAAPVVVSLTPANVGLAGIEEVTITGHNFSPIISENAVYFGNRMGTIISADTNKLVVKAPNFVKDTLFVKVSRQNALLMSNSVQYKLISAFRVVAEFGPGAGTTPAGLTFDKNGNMYYFLGGIRRIDTIGVTSVFAPRGAETFWSSLKFGRDGSLFAARSVAAVFRIVQGVAPATWVTSSAGLGSTTDFDFDQNGNMWAAGNATIISRIKPDKTVKAFASPTFVVRAVRIYNNFLYLGGKKDNVEGVWRAPIVSTDSLGAIEPYFNFTAAGFLGEINGLAFSIDGFAYLSVGTGLTVGVEPIIVVKPDRTANVLYPGVLNPTNKMKAQAIFWGTGDYLYFVRQIANTTEPPKEAIVEVYIGKKSAPYFGNQ